MRSLCLLSIVLAGLVTQPQTTWTLQQSGVAARLRGVSVASADVAWASGSAGTVLRTEDRGATWRRLTVPDAEKLDFRDVDAVDERTAFVLSIGPGDASRIYKSADAGSTWTLQFRNTDPDAFYDAMAFRDAQRGYAISDSVGGRFVILTTENGGANWNRLAPDTLPAALEGEGAYAASGSNIALHGDHVWVGTTAARVLRSTDGRTWTVARTPLATGPSAGIFSIAFSSATHGVVVGGDYKKEAEAVDNAAVTEDGGRTWTMVRGLSGFRSAVAYVPGSARTFIAVGPSGSDISTDGGRTWRPLGGPGFHALAFAPRVPIAWAVGEKGIIGRSIH